MGGSPLSVVPLDLNRDGKLDPTCANYGSGTVSILPGDGAGGFPTVRSFLGGTGSVLRPTSIAVADVNRDGIPDLLVGDEQEPLAVLLGR